MQRKMDKFGEMPPTKVLLSLLVERCRHQHIRPADAEISSSLTSWDFLDAIRPAGLDPQNRRFSHDGDV
jgi:hypothetical protein